MKPLNKRLLDKLEQRKEEGTLRSLSNSDGLVDFYSNDYLSLAKVAAGTSSNLYSGTGSRLISGTKQDALVCEQNVSAFFGYESALMFNSGYDANLGLFSSVPQKGDTVLYDSEIHASIRDGIRLSFGNSFSFQHNDLDDLERLLNKSKSGSVYVVVESLYSMKGDLAPLVEIAELSERNGAYLIVDEAHAAGVLGEEGKGLVFDLGVQEKVFAVVVTFGKAFGAHGAAILCSNDLKLFLINFARSFIYTTALPPDSYSRITEILKREDLEKRRLNLKRNISLLRKIVPSLCDISSQDSPIQILPFRNRYELRKMAEMLQSAGYGVKPIYAPTVAENEECLRINLHTENTEEDIRKLAVLLNPALC